MTLLRKLGEFDLWHGLGWVSGPMYTYDLRKAYKRELNEVKSHDLNCQFITSLGGDEHVLKLLDYLIRRELCDI